jgi:outer membrane protein
MRAYAHLDNGNYLSAIQDYSRIISANPNDFNQYFYRGLSYQKANDYQQNVNTMSDLIRQTKEKELVDLQNRIQAFQQSADQDLSAKQAELFNPLIEKVKNAISEVALENNYTYVFDVGTGSLVFYENGDNILPLVKKKLGIK